MPLPYVPPSDDVTLAPETPAPGLRGVFGELPAPVFGAVVEPAPGPEVWTARVAAPLRPSTPRWYRANPHALALATLWVLPFFALSVGTLLRMDAPAWAYPLALLGHVVTGALPVAAVAELSRSRWSWWYYPGGVLLLAAAQLFVLHLLR